MYKYKVVERPMTASPEKSCAEKLSEELTKLAEEGWELVEANSQLSAFLFRRPTKEQI